MSSCAQELMSYRNNSRLNLTTVRTLYLLIVRASGHCCGHLHWNPERWYIHRVQPLLQLCGHLEPRAIPLLPFVVPPAPVRKQLF